MVLTRDQLLEATRAHDFESYDRAIDIQISRLRRKLGQDGTRLIATVRNEGYQFAAAVVRR
jgi:two-component system OmpR family response regulator